MRARALGCAVLAGAAVWLWWAWEPPATGRLLFGGWRFSDAAIGGTAAVTGILALTAARNAILALRLALVMFGGGIAYAATEVAWLCTGGSAPPAPAFGAEPLPSVQVRLESAPDIAVAWGLDAERTVLEYRTNRYGFRNDPDSESADVFCVGDSCLVAALVPWEHTVVSRLEAALGRPCMNVALIAQSPQRAIAHFQAMSPPPALAGRTVLQFICEDNDLLDSAGDDTASGWHDAALWRRTLLHRVVMSLQCMTQPVVAEAPRRTGTYHGTPVRFLWLHERGGAAESQIARIGDALEGFARWLEVRGAEYGVVLIPSKIRVLGAHCEFPDDSDIVDFTRYLSPMPEFLAEWSQRAGVPFLDLTSALSEVASTGGLVWFPDDTHWNSLGQQVASEAILRWQWFRVARARWPR